MKLLSRSKKKKGSRHLQSNSGRPSLSSVSDGLSGCFVQFMRSSSPTAAHCSNGSNAFLPCPHFLVLVYKIIGWPSLLNPAVPE